MLGELDRAFGTLSGYADARVLCVSLNTRTGQLSTDLLFDSIRAWARPGTKSTAPQALVAARGRVEADIEGTVLASVRDAAGIREAAVPSVRGVFQAADAAGIEAIALVKEEKALLERVQAPPHVKRIITERLDAGRLVLVPERPVRIAGMAEPMTAWYEVDRESGEWIGVQQDGRHATLFGFILIHKGVNLGASIAGTYWSQFSLTIFRYAAGVLHRVTAIDRLAWPQIRLAAIQDAAKPEVRRMVGKCIVAAVSLVWQTKAEAALSLAAGQMALLAGQASALLWLERNTPM
jgi:hypothetical protein